MVLLAATAYESGRYLHWGAIQISVTNLAIILLMLVVFVLALVLPFPRPHDVRPPERRR
jgi:hypothetical protein